MIWLPAKNLLQLRPATATDVTGRLRGVVLALTVSSGGLEPEDVADRIFYVAEGSGSSAHLVPEAESAGADRLAVVISSCAYALTGAGVTTDYPAPTGYTLRTTETLEDNRLAVATRVVGAGKIPSGNFDHQNTIHATGEIAFVFPNTTYRAIYEGAYTIGHETTLETPAGTQEGDYLLAVVMSRGNYLRAPNGWERIRFLRLASVPSPNNAPGTPYFRQYLSVYRKGPLTSGELSDTYTFRQYF